MNHEIFNNQRRANAIAPYLERGSWQSFPSFVDFEERYHQGWVTGELLDEGYPVDFSFRPKKDTKRLAVVFNSQQNSDGRLKLFTWEKVAANIDASCLHISDPTLYASESAVIGWYTCNLYKNFQNIIHRLIESIANKFSFDEFVFLGSSAGGFPAFLYSQLFNNSTALLLAPTLSASDSRHDEPRRQYIDDLNNGLAFDELRQKYPSIILSAAEILKINSNKIQGSLNILQSVNDFEFWRDHTSNLLRELGYSIDYDVTYMPRELYLDSVSILLGDWGSGHQPPPVSAINKAVEQINTTPPGQLNTMRLNPVIRHIK